MPEPKFDYLYEAPSKTDKEGQALYKGYFNYYCKHGTDTSGLKTYNFRELTKGEVKKLRDKFTNKQLYVFKGEIVTREVRVPR